MFVLIALFLLYLACFVLYHAGERRTAFDRLRQSPLARQLVRVIAWGLTMMALLVLVEVQGWERGIPTWVALLGFAGVISLFVSQLSPKQHVPSGLFAAAGVCVVSILVFMGVGQ